MKSQGRGTSYKEIVDYSPVAIMEMDYSPVVRLKAQLQKQGVSNIRHFLLDHPELVKKTFRSARIINANAAALTLYGAKNKQELSAAFSRIFTTSAMDVLIEQMVSLASGESSFDGEFKCRSARKMFQDVFLSASVPFKYSQSLSRVILTLQDITVWKDLERQLRKRAKLDGLTKLLNHSAIVERMEEEIIRAKRYGLCLSCFMIDLDFFKVINDKFGHPRGDKILKRVANMIRKCFRKVDIVGRYGGDEFLVILPETKIQLAGHAAARLQKIFSATVFKYKRVISFHVTLSIGIAGYPSKKVRDAKDLISLADKAMYACKCAGRNRIEISKE